MNGAMVVSLGFIYAGLTMLKAVWQGRVPRSVSLWGQDETGKTMRREQRLLFGFGGMLMLFLGLVSLLHRR
jgi:hypothetical protein